MNPEFPTTAFFQSTKPQILSLWNKLFITQVDVSFPLELPAFFRSDAWHAAQKVIDLGTGNGYFLSRVSNVFPKKRLLGVDISKDFIEMALGLQAREKVRFVCRDLFDERGIYDYAILRALIQHIDDYPRFIEKLSSLVSRGGTALVIELSDANPVFFRPPAPQMHHLYTKVGKWQRARRPRDFRTLADFKRLAVASKAWRLVSEDLVVIPSTIEPNLRLFRNQFSLVLELLHSLRALPELNVDYADSKKEWASWCRLPRAYAQLTLRIMELTRI